MKENKNIISVKNIDVVFPIGKSFFRAVNNVSFDIKKKEILSLVGESGSGKSTIGKTLVGLNAFANGEITINNFKLQNNPNNYKKRERKNMVKDIQYIFQDPASSLTPSKTIMKTLKDVYKHNFKYKDYKINVALKILDKYITKLDWLNIFGQDYKFIKNNHVNLEKSELEKIYYNFYLKQNNLYVNYKMQKQELIAKQKTKQITDKAYLNLLKELKKTYLTNRKNNLINANASSKQFNSKSNSHPSFFKLSKIIKIKKRIAKLLLDNKLTWDEFNKISNKKYNFLKLKNLKNSIINMNKDIQNFKFETKENLLQKAITKATESSAIGGGILDKKPFTLSGGQQQRAVIARTLMVNPRIIVADEPVSALDLSIQSQIIKTLKNLRDKHGITILFIAHDIDMVKNISDKILVMYRGSIVEKGIAHKIFKNPIHPYTKALFEASPDILSDHKISISKYNFDQSSKREWFSLEKNHSIFCLPDELKQWQGGNS